MNTQQKQLSMLFEQNKAAKAENVVIDRLSMRNAQLKAMFELLYCQTAGKKQKYRFEFLFEKLGKEFFISGETVSKIVKDDNLTLPEYEDCCFFYKQVFDKDHKPKPNGLKTLESIL
jgi:hypothetical protein